MIARFQYQEPIENLNNSSTLLWCLQNSKNQHIYALNVRHAIPQVETCLHRAKHGNGLSNSSHLRSPPHVGQIQLHQDRVQADPFDRQGRDFVDVAGVHTARLEGGDGGLGAGDRVG